LCYAISLKSAALRIKATFFIKQFCWFALLVAFLGIDFGFGFYKMMFECVNLLKFF